MTWNDTDRPAARGIRFGWPAGALALAAFGGLLALNGSTLDIRVSEAVRGLRTPSADAALRLLTRLGDPRVLLVLALLLGAVAFLRGHPVTAGFGLLTGLGAPLNFGLKLLIRHPRPPEAFLLLGSAATGTGFPSGHAMAACISYGFLACLVARASLPRGWRAAGVALLALVILLVGFSRVYLGVHWPTDVLAGWLAGGVVLAVLVHAYDRRRGRAAASAASAVSGASGPAGEIR